MFGRKKKDPLLEENQRLQERIELLKKKEEEQELLLEEIQTRLVSNSLNILPTWKKFLNFLQSQESLEISDQFTVQEKENHGIYQISFQLRNGRNNQYSKGRGGWGILSKWMEYSGKISNFVDLDKKGSIPQTSSIEEQDSSEESDSSLDDDLLSLRN